MIADLVGRRCADCWEAARLVWAEMGLALPATPELALAGVCPVVEVLPPGEGVRAGDMLVFEFADGGGTRRRHIGIATDAHRMVHGDGRIRLRSEPIDRYAAHMVLVGRPRLPAREMA